MTLERLTAERLWRLRRRHTCGGTLAHAQDGRTALLWAASEGHLDCARLLLNAGADKDIVNNVRGRSEASNDVLFCLRPVCQSQVRMLGNVIFFFLSVFCLHLELFLSSNVNAILIYKICLCMSASLYL